MKPLIVANWKCNPTNLDETGRLFNSIKAKVKKIKNVEIVICPPFVYLSKLFQNKNLKTNIKAGAQNCLWEEKGAFTGEISPLMLKDLNIDYVIIGHSERRKFFKETDEQINKKIERALVIKLRPILCVGETKNERENGKKAQVLRSQIKDGLKKVSRREIKNIAIAYEPIWAIGTGNSCSINETMSSVIFIRKIISHLYGRALAENLKILYGGSVTSENALDYVKEAGANGLLVGGASLNAKEFVKIIKSLLV